MARQVIGIQPFGDWGLYEALYGPQPNLEQQVYGKPLKPEPVAIVRSKPEENEIAVPETPWGAADEVIYFAAFTGLDTFPQYFLVPYRLGMIASEDATEGGHSQLSVFQPFCRARILSKVSEATPGYIAATPHGPGAAYVHVWEGNDLKRYQYFAFGFPRPGTWDWIGYKDEVAVPLIEFQWGLTASVNAGQRKSLYLPPIFEALAFDKRSVDHSAFVEHFYKRGDGRFAITDVDVDP